MRSTAQILALLCISVLCEAQIGAKAITGLWQNSQFGYQMVLMLNADGTGEFDGDMISYKTQGPVLSISQKGVTTPYTYSLQGNSLILSGGDLTEKVTFARNGAQGPVSAPPAANKTPATSTSDLTGLWSGNGETLEFRTDGNCIYQGNSFPYQVSAGHITLSTSQGAVMFAYSIQGKQLTLKGSGGDVVYTRGAAVSNNPAATATGGKSVPQELVGRWQWININSTNSGASSSSKFIVLYANGTYEYGSETSRSVNTDAYSGGTSSQSADRGTWWVQGDRIYYNSQSSGQGSYQLQKRNHPKNNDPMIVLDGETYVTSTARNPWR